MTASKGFDAGDGERSEQAAGAKPLSPRPVTRGEETQHKVIVDWLNATFPAPKLSPQGFVALLARLLGRPISGIQDRGLLGFEKSIKLFASHGSVHSSIGALAFGGESQNGRWLLQFTGTGCAFVNDWDGMSDLLHSLQAKITRLDLACDFLQGEHSVEEAVGLYEVGGFNIMNTEPKSRLDGDWIRGVDGRSFYVGKSRNGKMLRVYEKGRQLGDPASDWVRYEVQLGSRDRVIPFDALTNREAYFAGCYPVLQTFIDDAAERIPTHRKAGEVSIANLFFHLKRSYGKLADVLAETGAPSADLVEEIRIKGIPRRVNLSSMAAGVSWVDVKAQQRRLSQ